jgi:hypothetical protein
MANAPTHDRDAPFASLMTLVCNYQMALRVVREMAIRGPGSAAQIAERMTEAMKENGDDPIIFTTELVVEAFSVLDQWDLLDLQGLEDDDPVGLVSL